MYRTCCCYFIMCFCDGYSFVVINTLTGEKQFIEGDETLCEFFQGRYTLPHLFHRLLKKEYVRLDDTLYQLCYNSHPDCQRVKTELTKVLSVEDPPGLWKICPKEYRHLLRDERRSELQNRKVELW